MSAEQRDDMSVVIPTYNRARLIERAISSALNQSRPAAEIIVVDDGSDDETGAIVDSIRGPIRYVRQDNLGGAAARNTGVELANGSWVAFLDSDDLWDNKHLERITDAIDATDGAAGLYFADTELDSDWDSHRLWELAEFRPASPFELAHDARQWILAPLQPMMLQSSVVNVKTYRSIGGLDQTLTRRHDTSLFFRMGLAAPMCAVAGIGARMTADDHTGRLTIQHGGETVMYWDCTQRLYANVLAAWDPARRAETTVLARRVAHAHRRLARTAVRDRHFRSAAKHVAAAIRLDPVALLHALRRKTTRSPSRSADV